MLKELIVQGEKVFKKFLGRSYHLDQPNSIVDPEYSKTLLDDFTQLKADLSSVLSAQPKTVDEVLINELARVADFCVSVLDEDSESRAFPPEKIFDMYSVEKNYFDDVKVWLSDNREKVRNVNKRQLENYAESGRTRVMLGSKLLRDRAEKIGERLLGEFTSVVGSIFPMPGYQEFLNNYCISFDSFEKRSYANRKLRVVMLSTSDCFYGLNGELFVDPVLFIRAFGHEVLGHAMNYYLTDQSTLPLFAKENYFAISSSTRESICEYFEDRLFELLRGHSDKIGVLEKLPPFDVIYQRYEDTKLLDIYSKKLFRLGIWILANSTKSDYDKKIFALGEYSIEPKWLSWFVNKHRDSWDKSSGLLLSKITRELRYANDIVPEIIATTGSKGPSVPDVEKCLLTGTWSPQGLVEWVRLG